jgi:hypothetical protein
VVGFPTMGLIPSPLLPGGTLANGGRAAGLCGRARTPGEYLIS